MPTNLPFGCAESVKITKDHTTIVNGKGKKEELEARIRQIDGEVKEAVSQYDREHLEERRAKLQGGIAVIRIGAVTEPEMKQKKQAFEDSLNATRAAQEGGYVVGGGTALLRGSQAT